jgi:PhnB protein
MKNIIPEIYVENCKDALEYYKSVFGGEIRNVQMADDKEMFKGYEGKVIHSELHISVGCVIYLYDILQGEKETGNNHILLELESEDEINRIYLALSENGNVHYELQKTFWGAYHAVVTDRYGNMWGLNYSAR